MKEGSPTKKKVLVLENAIDVTGGLKSIINSSTSLAPDFEFIFLLPEKSRCVAYVSNQGFNVIEFPFRELNRNFFSWIMYLPFLFVNTVRLSNLIKKLDINLLIANDFYNLLPAMYRFSGGRIPFICFVRFIPDRFPGVLVKTWKTLQQKFAFRIIAVSKAVEEKLRPHKNLEIVYEGLPAIFDEIVLPVNNTSSTTLLYLSNYIEGKGQEFAVKSFASLAHKYPTWKLRFVGGDMGLPKNKEYKESLMHRATEMGIQHQVEWAGFSENVLTEYAAAAIVLNFSNSESFSLTCLEAMAMGCAVISTNSGGPAEIIEHNKSGLLVPIADVAAMSDAIERLILNPDIREKMGKAAFHHVQKFDRKSNSAILQKIYKLAIIQGN